MKKGPVLFDIVFEHKDFLIINKYEGIEFHGDQGLVNQIRQKHEVFGVHRLDKPTSGLMIFARNKETQAHLSELFAQKKIKKIYLAVSDKRPSKKQGLIQGDLLKGRGGNYYLEKSKVNPSITRFYSDYDTNTKLRVFCLRPHTGRTHQLRVVLKSLGSTILGDKRYGGSSSDRMYLHSYYLEFDYLDELYKFKIPPKTGEYFKVISIDKFENLLEKIIS